MRGFKAFLAVGAVILFAGLAVGGCQTAGAVGKEGTALEIPRGDAKFKGDNQIIFLGPVAVEGPQDLPKTVKTRGGPPAARRPLQKVHVTVPQTCQGMEQCVDDGSFLDCSTGEWVQKPCQCGCLFRNGHAICKGEQCKPGSTRTILDQINNTQITEVCEDDGCGYRQK
jgi:hypothetical protein